MSLIGKLFGKAAPTPTPSQHAAARATEASQHIQSLRKGAGAARDAAIRGPLQASSARDYMTRSLGKPTGPQGGTSLGRMGSNPNPPMSSPSMGSMSGLAPKMPPFKR